MHRDGGRTCSKVVEAYRLNFLFEAAFINNLTNRLSIKRSLHPANDAHGHFLGKKIRAEVVYDRNGRFENRAFGNSACCHRIEDESGKTADEFRCDLIMAIGDMLGDP
jgi:hypothetical protein